MKRIDHEGHRHAARTASATSSRSAATTSPSTSRPTPAATTPARARRSCSPPASPRAPRSRWRCTPSARAGTLGDVEVACDYTPAERGCPTRFRLVAAPARRPHRRAGRAPAGHRRQVPGAPHARRRGHVRRACRARRARALTPEPGRGGAPAARRPPRPRRGRGARRPRPHRRGRARPAVPRRDGELHAVFTRRRDDLRRHAGEISFPGGRQDDDERPAADRAARGRGGDRAAAERRRARRRAAAHADDRDQLRRLPLRRAHRAGPRVAPVGERGRGGARAVARATCAPATGAGGCCAAASRSAPTSTSSATTSSGARRPGSSPTCSPGWTARPSACRLARPPSRRPSRSGRRRGCPTRSTSRRSS